MGLLVTTGSQGTPTATGTQNIAHGHGVAPDLLIVIAPHGTTLGFANGDAKIHIGFSNGTEEVSYCTHFNGSGNAGRYHTDKIVGLNNLTAEFILADTSSVDATNWVLNFTTVQGVPWIYQWIAISGLTEAKVITGSSPTATGNQNVAHGMGGAPDSLIGVMIPAPGTPPLTTACIGSIGFWGGGQGVSSWHSQDTDSSKYQDQSNFLQFLWTSQSDLELASVASVDATNIVLNWSKVFSDARHYFILAVRGVDADFISDTSPTSAGTKATTTAFQPEVIFLASVGALASASIDPDHRISFGFGKPGSVEGVWSGVEDAYSNRNNAGDGISSETDVVTHSTPKAGAPAVEEAATLDSFNATDVTLDWNTVTASEFQWNGMVWRQKAAAGGDSLAWNRRGRRFMSHLAR